MFKKVFPLLILIYKKKSSLGKPQKNSFLSGRATKRGGGLNGCATKKTQLFLM